ncbi:MAG: hypothetical protein DLM57_04555 [Pseudonocardiales bacterium]|nr:MAG: hypothetical protein DLM57_04555 [Pseudonocardiales bacterium]
MRELEVSYDPDTLREVYADQAAVRERISDLRASIPTASDSVAELLARGELVARLRGLGDLDDALAEGRLALQRAELVGTPVQQHLAVLRLAHVLQWRAEFAESNLLFTDLLTSLDRFGPVIEAFTHQRAGENAYDQRHYPEAIEHFARALAIRREFEAPEDQIASSRLALDAAERGVKGST